MKGIWQWAKEPESQRPNLKTPHEKNLELKPKQVDIRFAELLIYQKCILVSRVFAFMDHCTDPNYRNMVIFDTIQ